MTRKDRFPPGPPTRFLGLSHVRRMREELLEFPTELTRTYGDLVHVRMGPVHAYFANHPDLVREVLVTRGKSFRKLPRIIQAFRTVDGNGLVLSEGDFWLRQRRLVQPAFSAKRFDGYAKTTVECAQQMVDSWRPKVDLEVLAESRRLALRIVTRTLFGTDVIDAEGKLGEVVEVLSEIITRQTGQILPIPEWVPLRMHRRKREAVRVLDDVIGRIIQTRRESGQDRGDLLSMLLNAVDIEGDGRGMTDEQVRDEVITLFNAGHDTTSAGLVWIWYLLAMHPEVETQVRAELQSRVGDRPATFADMAALPYTTQVVKESLRLYPPTWALIPRTAIERVTIGGYLLPKGAWVHIHPWVLHRDPRFFPNPERFDPDRFAIGRAGSIPQHAYIPFGAGPHMCIGNTFAMMEMVLSVATVVRRFHLVLSESQPKLELDPFIALRPRGGLKIRVEPVAPPVKAAPEPIAI